MPTWPSNVPFIDAYAGAAREVSGGQLRYESDIGPAQVRRRTSATPMSRDGATVPITLALLTAFEAFFRDDLGDGALSFDVIDPFDDEVRSMRFVGGYQVSRVGTGFVVSATLEVLP